MKFDRDNTALIGPQGALTYAQVIEAADGIAGSVETRSLVFLIASNTIDAICGYVGFLRKRAVTLMLKDDISAGQLTALIDAYAPQYLWIPEEQTVDYPNFKAIHEFGGYRLIALENEPYELNPDLALLLTTSGSTGSPKLVRLSYENLLSNAQSIAQYQRISPEDRAITTLPFSYSYGISIVNSHLVSGASLAVCDESIMSAGFWEFLKEKRATNFGGVPYTYQMLDRLRFAKRDLSSLRFISQAGGRLDESLQAKFAGICSEKDIEFFVMYGQTEATARISWLPPEYAASKVGSIGIPIPGGILELHDIETGEIIEGAGKEGELVYRGPNVSMGYANCCEDLAKPDELKGHLHTGDLARRDEDGFYYITARLKRFLKMFGNRVSLDEVEKLLESSGWLAAATGEDNHLRVYTTADDTEAVLSLLARDTGLHPSGLHVTHIDELPRTSSGKIDYKQLA